MRRAFQNHCNGSIFIRSQNGIQLSFYEPLLKKGIDPATHWDLVGKLGEGRVSVKVHKINRMETQFDRNFSV